MERGGLLIPSSSIEQLHQDVSSFSQDEDLLSEASRRQRSGEFFAGVIYAHQLKVSVGQCIEDLELLAKVNEPEDFANRVEYLPLK